MFYCWDVFGICYWDSGSCCLLLFCFKHLELYVLCDCICWDCFVGLIGCLGGMIIVFGNSLINGY